jgi:hypothetical protein
MVNPAILCRKHLIAENVEAHMFISSIKKGISMAGYLKNNLLEPLSLVSRHDEIAIEMIKRGYNHNSPVIDFVITDYITDPKILNHKVNYIPAFKDLVTRCSECRKRFLWYVTNNYAEITDDIKDIFTLQEWLVSNINRYEPKHIQNEEGLIRLECTDFGKWVPVTNTNNQFYQLEYTTNNYDKVFLKNNIYFDYLGEYGGISGDECQTWETLSQDNYEFLKLKFL